MTSAELVLNTISTVRQGDAQVDGLDLIVRPVETGILTYSLTDAELAAMIALASIRPSAVRLQTPTTEALLSRFGHMSGETRCHIANAVERDEATSKDGLCPRGKTVTGAAVLAVFVDAKYSAAYCVLWGQVFAVNGFAKMLSPSVEFAPIGIDFEHVRLSVGGD